MKTNISGIVSGIYKIEDIVNGYVYVGSANKKSGIAKRWSNHCSKLKRGIHEYKKLQDSWNQNVNNIKWEILEECSDDVLEEREAWWMNYVQKVDGWTLINKQKDPVRKSSVKDTSKMKDAQSGSRNGNKKYNEELIREIKIKMANGVSLEEISEETGISVNYLNQIKYGYKWSSVLID